jgi:hypothetical protein
MSKLRGRPPTHRARRVQLAGLVLLALLGLGAVARAEVVQKGSLRVSFQGELSPHSLPRASQAPIRVSVAADIASTSEQTPPQLRRMSIAINRYGHLDSTGLPVCELKAIQPATTADALAVCRRSLVGEGRFSANVLLKGQAPFPSDGKVYAFNGELDGKPAILAHVYGTNPAPTSYTLPFVISQAKGTFGTTLTASLPRVTSDSGYVTGLSLKLGKSFSYGGKKHSYLSASCPAPKGFPGATFPFAKASFDFAGGPALSSTLTRSCKVR